MPFITLEGVEGSGKSTQMELLKEYFEARGIEAVALREPGGTAAAERIRAILLNEEGYGLSHMAELFLYEACRAEVVEKVIRPALNKDRTVICDRYTDSTIAYQGYGRGLEIKAVDAMNRLATGGLVPDLTLLIDLDPAVGLKRAFSRISKKTGAKEDRFEKEEFAFHERVRNGYLKIAGAEPLRVMVIDGTKEILSIHSDICDIIEKNGL
ncbi:MAG: dTMP kinase [Thermodesulfobacteriota bacterium]|nr:MAG: dTMP kinase [Thermodesulfobacteriota bacterium]